jgi:DNA repair and recombination protein RAD52
MLTLEQIALLDAPLSRDVVKTRTGFSYIEGWHALSEANRIFGFDGWSSQTTDIRCVIERERTEGGFSITYVAKVRVTVGDCFHEGYGAGTGIHPDPGLAHEKAIKEAETDARKRALMQFGNPFGLALYDKTQANVADEGETSRQLYIEQCKTKIAEFADGDRDAILKWWYAEEPARQDFGLSPTDTISLKNLASAKSKLPQQTATSRDASLT